MMPPTLYFSSLKYLFSDNGNALFTANAILPTPPFGLKYIQFQILLCNLLISYHQYQITHLLLPLFFDSSRSFFVQI